MESGKKNITAETLQTWLEKDEPVFILDVRPKEQREEWQIPESHYLDAYKRLNEGDNSVLDEIEIPENSKVVTVCAAGRVSQLASNALRKKGIEAYSLEGGMKSWSKSWNTSSVPCPCNQTVGTVPPSMTNSAPWTAAARSETK